MGKRRSTSHVQYIPREKQWQNRHLLSIRFTAGQYNDLPVGPINQEELDKVLLNWGSTADVLSAAYGNGLRGNHVVGNVTVVVPHLGHLPANGNDFERTSGAHLPRPRSTRPLGRSYAQAAAGLATIPRNIWTSV